MIETNYEGLTIEEYMTIQKIKEYGLNNNRQNRNKSLEEYYGL